VKKRLAVAFTGPSNSGKTTYIEKIAKILIDDYKMRVSIIKNDPKDKAIFDVEGKDSYKFSQTGADVVVTSPTRTTYFSKRSKNLDEIIDMLNEFDILLVEGLKTLPLPRIAIFRDKFDEKYLNTFEAIATDGTVDSSTFPEGIEILDLNNPQDAIEWLFKNSKKV